MTIDELLDEAQLNLSLIDGAIGRDEMLYAVKAQAYAQTAQAMILYTACSKGSGMNNVPSYSLRVLADVVMG